MKKIFILLLIILNICCSVEYTKNIDNEIFTKIIRKNYPELGEYEINASLINDTLNLIFPDLKENLFNEITGLKEYKKIRMTAKEIFVKQPQYREKEKILFNFQTLNGENKINYILDFWEKDFFEEYESKIKISEFKKMIGQPVNDEKIFKLLQNNYGNPEILNNTGLEYHLYGIEIGFLSDSIYSIVIHLNDKSGLNPYNGELPEKFNRNMTLEELQKQYGKAIESNYNLEHYVYPNDSLIYYFEDEKPKIIYIQPNPNE